MNSKNKNIVITSAVRTAVGTFKGSLKNMQGHDLGSVVIKGAMEKSKLKMNEVRDKIRLDKQLFKPGYQSRSLLTLLIKFVDQD